MTDGPDWFQPKTLVRITGGKFNGFEGEIAKTCNSFASVWVSFEGKRQEVFPVGKNHLMPLDQWKAGKNDTELFIRGFTK